MRTGRYRLRRGIFGLPVLQEEFDHPALIGGHVDASIRQRSWADVSFDRMSHVVFYQRDSEMQSEKR